MKHIIAAMYLTLTACGSLYGQRYKALMERCPYKPLPYDWTSAQQARAVDSLSSRLVGNWVMVESINGFGAQLANPDSVQLTIGQGGHWSIRFNNKIVSTFEVSIVVLFNNFRFDVKPQTGENLFHLSKGHLGRMRPCDDELFVHNDRSHGVAYVFKRLTPARPDTN